MNANTATTAEQLQTAESKLAEAGRIFGAINRLLADKAPALLDSATSDENFHAADDLIVLLSAVADRGAALAQQSAA